MFKELGDTFPLNEVAPNGFDAAEAVKTIKEQAERAWDVASKEDFAGNAVEKLRDRADEAWNQIPYELATAGGILADGIRNTEYYRGRLLLGAGKLGEDAFKSVYVWGLQLAGDSGAAVDAAQKSVIDDIADKWGEMLDVSEQAVEIGNAASLVGEVIGGAALAIAAVALLPEEASVAAALITTDIVMALGVSGEVLSEFSRDGELATDESLIAAAAGAGSAVLAHGAGKVAEKIIFGVKEGLVQTADKFAGRGAADEVVRSAEDVMDGAAREGGEATVAREVAEKAAREFIDDSGKAYRKGDDLLPNNTFEREGYKYVTDDAGRVKSAEGQLRLKEGPRKTIADDMDVVAKGDQLPGDERSHLVADKFGGPAGLENLVAMDGKEVNRSAYRKIECRMEKALREGKEVLYKVEVQYSGDSHRPTGFLVTDRVDGKTTTTFVRNVEGVR